MFELNQLLQLVTIADEGTLSAAAEKLHISQPALSRSMQKLEDHFGAPLFRRTKNRMALNEVGVCAVQNARRVLESSELFDHAVKQKIRSLSTFVVGASSGGPLWQIMPELSLLVPGVPLSSDITADEDALEEDFRTGKYRLLLLSHPLEGKTILCKHYITEQLYVSFPAGHQLASRKSLYAKDLAGLTMLLYSIVGIWGDFHEKMTETHFIVQNDRQAFSDLVTASFLPNFVTNISKNFKNPQQNRVMVPLMDKDAKKEFYLCVHNRDQKLFRSITPVEITSSRR